MLLFLLLLLAVAISTATPIAHARFDDNGRVCSPNFPLGPDQDSDEINPEITWSHTNSNGTVQSFIVMMDDLSFDYFLHWLVKDLPADTRVILRGQSDNTNGTTVRAYIGPCSPFVNQDNNYRFTIYGMPTATTPVSIVGKKGDDLDAEFRRTALNAYSFVVINYRYGNVPCPDQNIPCL